MLVSQKCQYAVRATFELAKRYGNGPVRIADIAEAQAIPVRFLEVILNQLKQGGFVLSHRGSRGGYLLARPPAELTVGDIIRFIEGPLGPVICAMGSSKSDCRLYGECVFLPMWERVRAAISGVYDQTTFQSLVEMDALRTEEHALSYSI
ncbi:MAG: Rrf2 family transcriptional regulator [Planctomycetes bacterium]|nr:Rrf2 family transcriptional regulator [Planctomycetota bacterium]